MGKKKKKPSKYNIFVGKRMKAGDTLSQAAKAWNKQKSGSKKKPTKKKTSRPRKKPTTQRTRRRPRPRGQKKPMFPLVNQLLFRGPIRQRVRSVLGV